ncbi:V-type ATP synthase subunit F [Aeropyrum camini]|uniref:V-type ATP synthase subunit F n=1 Tax=Aeropyrum camini SY1 = JCM 12091 TaxID=1198449 RepID=U3TCK2_9CREN|nr:V-type ATP synthase subunit F [Aeropyrum camini]BAN89765.1 V-type ATP synthase subunit F [Aeropyrum camini SY1 = JCM 12091]
MAEAGGKLLAIVDRETAPLFMGVGASVVEVAGGDEVLRALRKGVAEGGARIVLVLKHLVEDEELLRREADRLGATLLVIPSMGEKAEPIDVKKLIARALGFG